MRVLGRDLKAVLQLGPKWSSLSKFGNSTLAKLVFLSPIISTAIYFNRTYLSNVLRIDQAVWLYWSLIAISFGQLVYFFACPRIIKSYGDDRERFTIESLTSRPIPELQEIRASHVRSLYKQHGGKLDLPLDPADPNFFSKFERMLLDAKFSVISDEQIHHLVNVYRDYYYTINNQLFSSVENLDFVNLEKIWASCPKAILGQPSDEGIMSEYAELSRIFRFGVGGPRQGDDDWKVLSLDWYYHHLNSSRRLLRAFVTALFAGGGFYFLFRVLAGVWTMGAYALGMPIEDSVLPELPVTPCQQPEA